MIPGGSHISPISLSNEVMEKARLWLKDCIDLHACPTKTCQPLPKRVICVGDEHSKPFLHEPSRGEIGCWVALSYRWGKQNVLTTLSTLQSRIEGFGIDELPRTCRDAVRVTRALGIPYLWIDATCMIQGEKAGWIWKTETAEMCSIYENAALTIAAVDSTHCDTGLSMTHRWRQAIKFDVLAQDGSLVPIFGRNASVVGNYGYMCRRPRHLPWVSLYNPLESLETRGWTLQELFMSSRILWFTVDQVGFSCPFAYACESQPRLRDRRTIDLPRYEKRLELHTMLLQGSEMQAWQDRWLDLVQDFTHRCLTKATDRLPALHGLITTVQRSIKDKCVAGLWTCDLMRQLLWCAWGEVEYMDFGTLFMYEEVFDSNCVQRWHWPEKQTDLGTGYAPSWSWASISQQVVYLPPSPHFNKFVWEVLDCHFTPGDGETLGCGKGFIIARGPLHQATAKGGVLHLANWTTTRMSQPRDLLVYMDGRLQRHEPSMLEGGTLSLLVARFDGLIDFGIEGILLESTLGALGIFQRVAHIRCYLEESRDNYENRMAKHTVIII